MEIRANQTILEIREIQENSPKTIQGYAIKWNELSNPIGGLFVEKFERGAFAESLKTNNQKAFWSHNSNYVLGSTRSNTLRLIEDDVGLRFEVDLPDSTWGNDAYTSIKRGDVDNVSFGFSLINKDSESWEDRSDGVLIRTVKTANLYEISPVAFPAYPQTEVSARSLEAYNEYKKSANPVDDTVKIYLRELRKKLLWG